MENKKRKRENSVTEDVVIDIITRLPAKDLVRFTCVSRSWRSLILTDPYLRRLQGERAASLHRPFLSVDIMSVDITDPKSWLHNNYWVDLDSIEGYNIRIEEINDPFGSRGDAKVKGACHGLVILQHQTSLKMAVSNPTTKRRVMVPPNPAGDANVVFRGFGHDRVRDCYKLVTQVEHKDSTLELMVYDLSKGAWGSLQFDEWWRSLYDELDDDDEFGQLDSRLDSYSAECVDGGLYWCIDTGDKIPRAMVTMLCFLLAEEEFHVVEPPDLGEVKYYPNMTVLNERLGLVCEGLDTRHEVWTTDMYYDGGGKRQWQWTKLFAIPDPYAKLGPNFDHLDVLIPVCFLASKNKVLVHVGGGKFFWYDLGKKEFRKLDNPVDDIEDCQAAISCVSRMMDLDFLFKYMF